MTKKRISYLIVLRKVLWAVICAAPRWIILDGLAMFLSAVCYALSTVAKQQLFDAITEVVNGNLGLNMLFWVSIFVIFFQMANELLNAVCNFTWEPASRAVMGKLKKKIHAKIARIPAKAFENVEILECIKKADMGVGNCYGLYNAMATVLVFYLPYFVVIGIYMWQLEPVLLLALLLIFIPLVLNLFIREKVFSKQIDESVSVQREVDYLETELFSREKLKENRTYGTYSFFKKKYAIAQKKFCKKKWMAVKKTGIIELGLRILTLCGYAGVVYLLLFLVIDGQISIGAFAAIFSSIATFISFMSDAICNYFGNMFENMGALRNYIEFLELPEESTLNKEIYWEKEIKVNQISFSYPGTEIKALDNISFTINSGETVAIVGENGAGKSTLVRILSGILEPDEGEVLVDGANIMNFNMDSRFAFVSAVFQKFIRYQMTLRENVEISNDIEDEERMRMCLEKSEFEMGEFLIDDYDTMLSREFKGVDLSGGQWQRIALARGLYRTNHFIILDEPTAAIDPIEEGILYRKFQDLIKDKMGVIVTHRLGSARIANKIIVLDKGKVIEIGTHKELMALGGKYATLYKKQAEWYQS